MVKLGTNRASIDVVLMPVNVRLLVLLWGLDEKRELICDYYPLIL